MHPFSEMVHQMDVLHTRPLRQRAEEPLGRHHELRDPRDIRPEVHGQGHQALHLCSFQDDQETEKTERTPGDQQRWIFKHLLPRDVRFHHLQGSGPELRLCILKAQHHL